MDFRVHYRDIVLKKTTGRKQHRGPKPQATAGSPSTTMLCLRAANQASAALINPRVIEATCKFV